MEFDRSLIVNSRLFESGYQSDLNINSWELFSNDLAIDFDVSLESLAVFPAMNSWPRQETELDWLGMDIDSSEVKLFDLLSSPGQNRVPLIRANNQDSQLFNNAENNELRTAKATDISSIRWLR